MGCRGKNRSSNYFKMNKEHSHAHNLNAVAQNPI